MEKGVLVDVIIWLTFRPVSFNSNEWLETEHLRSVKASNAELAFMIEP